MTANARTKQIESEEMSPAALDDSPLDPTEGYRAAASTAKEDGHPFEPVDQRTGRVIAPGAFASTPAQRQAELHAVTEADVLELDEFIEKVRVSGGEPVSYGSRRAFDQRRADQQLRATLEQLASESDGTSSLAARALQRFNQRAGLVKTGAGVRW